MQLIEKHIIKKSDKIFNELSNICGLSKNLYNVGLYEVRQYYFTEKKFLNYVNLNNKLVKDKQFDYYKLPSKVSQQTLKIVEQNFKSFFGSLKAKQKGKKVKLPRYLNKKGKFITTYTNQAISKTELKKGFIKLSGTDIKIKTNVKDVQQVRIVPKIDSINVEVVYNVTAKQLLSDNNRYCSIDLGLNNLATVASNVIKPIIINGKPIKSINQHYNKRKADLQSKLTDNKTSKLIQQISRKRNNKIDDYLHKTSRYIINHLVSNSINTLVVGYNKEWKQEINIGKKNNQKFVNIPYHKFLHMLRYKAQLEGITMILNEESYTSKCSFLDNEEVVKHDEYLGRRTKRGLFKSSTGKHINADLNGALNILKKVVGNFKYNPILACSTPRIITHKR
jgi:putative transposase